MRFTPENAIKYAGADFSIKQTLTDFFGMRSIASATWLGLAFVVAGCGARPVAMPEGHIQSEARPTASIPSPVHAVPLPPPPEARAAEIRYSVVVADQPVRDVLLAMARETQVNFDIHGGIEGRVNLNAIDQTLKQILTRISKQVDIRWEVEGQTITVMPDYPYLQNYRIDYVNLSRDVTGTIGVQGQVGSSIAGAAGNAGTSGSSDGGQNSSFLKVDAAGKNRFWETLRENIKDILKETDKRVELGGRSTAQAQRSQTESRTSAQASGSGQAAATQGGVVIGDAAAGRGTTVLGDSVSGRGNQSVQGGASRAAEYQGGVLTADFYYSPAASVIVNQETGVISVRATQKQQSKIAEFLANVIASAQRQVLIEATVVEVVLNDNYQAGVDWSALGLNGLGYSFRQNLLGPRLADSPFFSIQYSNPNAAAGGSISSTLKLLDSFGNTRVLSSPKIMALNNQTAIMKVVENRVYFSVEARVTAGGVNANPIVSYTTTQNVVPIGFVMTVTAQIAENGVIVLNVRPTISRIVNFVNDPNPDLARANVTNRVPEIESREFESVLRVPSGQTVILGGLMQDSFQGKRDGVPILSRIPFLGDAVSYRDDTSRKTELVIFLRPIVIRDASLEGDLAEYRRFMPDREFFRDTHPPLRGLEKNLQRMERGEFPDMRGTENPVVPPPPPGGLP